MKKYNLRAIDIYSFDTLQELQQIPCVEQVMQKPNFFRLSIWPGNYGAFALLAELHDGYVYKELGFLTRNLFNYEFLSNDKDSLVTCLDFDPIKELNITEYNYYNSKVYNLIGAYGAWIVADMFAKGADIDMIKKFISLEIKNLMNT